jgi:hypothetical protein
MISYAMIPLGQFGSVLGHRYGKKLSREFLCGRNGLDGAGTDATDGTGGKAATLLGHRIQRFPVTVLSVPSVRFLFKNRRKCCSAGVSLKPLWPSSGFPSVPPLSGVSRPEPRRRQHQGARR